MTRTIHELRISEIEFKAIEAGIVDFLIIENRGFQKGDLIKFKVLSDVLHRLLYTVDDLYEITYVLSGWGLKSGYVALGIRRSEEAETHE